MNGMSAQDNEYIANLLARRHLELLHELHHAVTYEFKAGLRQELELNEQLRAKLAAAVA